MNIAREMWFGLYTEVETSMCERLATSKNVFDAVLLGSFGSWRHNYRDYRNGIAVSNPRNPASDSHIAIAGFLLAGGEPSDQDESGALAKVLDAGLKKVSRKSPSPGMPAFANDWKLLLGAAAGIRAARRLSCDGAWDEHQSYIRTSIENLQRTDLIGSIMLSYVRSALGEAKCIVTANRDVAALSHAEVIAVVWANHVGLSVGMSQEDCWTTLADRLPLVRLAELDFHALALLLVILKDTWATNRIVDRSKDIDLVKAILRDFLACARRDLKAELLRNEADVQRVIWAILRPTFSDIVDEEYPIAATDFSGSRDLPDGCKIQGEQFCK
jgi:hypothetical protein